MVGGTAYVAGKAGAKAGAEKAAAAQPAAAPAQPEVADAAPAESNEDIMAQLTQLKGLLDSGVLTQAEFDAQKQKLLQQMS